MEKIKLNFSTYYIIYTYEDDYPHSPYARLVHTDIPMLSDIETSEDYQNLILTLQEQGYTPSIERILTVAETSHLNPFTTEFPDTPNPPIGYISQDGFIVKWIFDPNEFTHIHLELQQQYYQVKKSDAVHTIYEREEWSKLI